MFQGTKCWALLEEDQCCSLLQVDRLGAATEGKVEKAANQSC